jgi:hypothetical protein
MGSDTLGQNPLVGERFARFRAAWGDTFTYPLKGLVIKDRRRLEKLATTGHQISDPYDAQGVRELIAWHGRLIRRLLPVGALALPGFVAVDVFIMDRPRWVTGVLVVVYLLAALLALNRHRRHLRTSQANGWS